MIKSKVLIGPSSFGQVDDAPIKLLKQAGCDIIPNPYRRKYTKNEVVELLDNIDGIIAGLEPLDRDVLAASNLKVISRCGSGMSNVDRDAAREFGITVCNTPDGPTQAVAEITLGMLISIMRIATPMHAAMKNGVWDKRVGSQLAGKVLAIVGYGRIGRRFAELLEPFNLRLLIVDPYAPNLPVGTDVVDLPSALEIADIVSLHVSGDACILGCQEFSDMKPGMIVLNSSRGTSVNEAELVKALDHNIVQAAWLDALPEEPYTGSLLDYEQVILTPHIASYTREGRLKMELDSVYNLLDGLKLKN